MAESFKFDITFENGSYKIKNGRDLCLEFEFIEDEDAELVSGAPLWIQADIEDHSEAVMIRSKTSGYGNRIRISFSGLGFRRGVLLMEEMLPDFPKQKDGSSNWYIGFTVAGNGTPAFIFPVNDDLSRLFASRVLMRALL